MMRYYFAAAYQRHAEMSEHADQLEMIPNTEVVSSWHRKVTPGLDASFDADYLAAHPAEAWEHGQRDIKDLCKANAIVSFTDGKPARGGRHVEHGYALAIVRAEFIFRLVIVGQREHVFHCHPDTEVYPTWDEFFRHEFIDAGAGLVRRHHPGLLG